MLSLKDVKNSERNLRHQHIFYVARNPCRMSDTGTSSFIFFQPPYLNKMVCFLNSWKQVVKTIVKGDNLRHGRDIGTIWHAAILVWIR